MSDFTYADKKEVLKPLKPSTLKKLGKRTRGEDEEDDIDSLRDKCLLLEDDPVQCELISKMSSKQCKLFIIKNACMKRQKVKSMFSDTTMSGLAYVLDTVTGCEGHLKNRLVGNTAVRDALEAEITPELLKMLNTRVQGVLALIQDVIGAKRQQWLEKKNQCVVEEIPDAVHIPLELPREGEEVEPPSTEACEEETVTIESI